MANCKIIHPSGGSPQTTYVCPKQFDYEHEVGPMETDVNSRALDGTARSYVKPVKETFQLTFSYTTKAHYDAFRAAWAAQLPIDLYLDGITKDATVKMIGPPLRASQPSAITTYSFSVIFEEV